MSGLGHLAFINLCSMQSRRSKTYTRYMPVIKKLMKNGIWNAMKNRKLSLDELKAFSFGYKIPESTIRSWNSKLLSDSSWLPLHKRTIKSPYMFTDKQETVIAEIIRQIYEDQNIPISNELVRQVAIRYYYKTHELDYNHQFAASHKWITRFKRVHRFSRRKFNRKRRSTSSQKSIIEFLTIISFLLNDVSPENILNVDETNWKVTDSGEYTWAETGSESVTIHTSCDEKSGFTVLSTINAAGGQFPLCLISKGKTEISESSWFGGGRNIIHPGETEKLKNIFYDSSSSRNSSEKEFIPQSQTDYSESGWTTQATWNNYLFNLRYNLCPPKENTDFYSIENRLYLICDSFPVHFSNESIEISKKMNIQLIKIPESTTDIFQPLDCRIFGALKSHARTFFNARIVKALFQSFDFEQAIFTAPVEQMNSLTRKEAVVVLENAWNSLTPDIILSAWVESLYKYFLKDENGTFVLNTSQVDELFSTGRFNKEDNNYNGFKDISKTKFPKVDVDQASLELLRMNHLSDIENYKKAGILKQIEKKKRSLEKQKNQIQKIVNSFENKRRQKSSAQSLHQHPSMNLQQQQPMNLQQQHPMNLQQQYPMNLQQQHPMNLQQQHLMNLNQTLPMHFYQQPTMN